MWPHKKITQANQLIPELPDGNINLHQSNYVNFVVQWSVFLFQSPDERGVIVQILESGYRFVLGSIGGGKFNDPCYLFSFLYSHEGFWNSKLINSSNLINKND